MRLLFVLDSLGTGGAERSVSRLWYFLRENKIEFSIVVFRHRKDGIENEILNEGFPVKFIVSSRLSAIKQLAKFIDGYKPDLVHSSLFTSNIRTRFAKVKSRHKFLHLESMVNCNYDKSRLQDPNVNLFKLKGYQAFDYITQLFLTDHYHANGLHVARHFQNALKVPEDKITIIHRGREGNPFKENKKRVRGEVCDELGISTDSLILIHIGRQEYQKAHDVLLKGLFNILKANNMVLLLAGREGNNSAVVQELASTMDQDTIRFLGHRYDIPRLLAASDIFVLPSRFEGLPGSMIEAEAAALPIVGSNIATISEVAVHEKNAILFPRDDFKELEVAVLKLVENPALRDEYGLESLKIFNEKFRIENINSRMLEMYRELLKK